MIYNRETFGMADRIVGTSTRAVILKGDDGENVFCHIRIFGRIMSDPNITFSIITRPRHYDARTGREFPDTKWICAYLPTMF